MLPNPVGAGDAGAPLAVPRACRAACSRARCIACRPNLVQRDRGSRGIAQPRIAAMKLSRNVGTPDRIIRLAVAGLLGVALLAGSVTGAAAYIAGAVAVLLFLTGAIGFCPLYALLGVRTCPLQRA